MSDQKRAVFEGMQGRMKTEVSRNRQDVKRENISLKPLQAKENESKEQSNEKLNKLNSMFVIRAQAHTNIQKSNHTGRIPQTLPINVYIQMNLAI
jgi:hypothetical protein